MIPQPFIIFKDRAQLVKNLPVSTARGQQKLDFDTIDFTHPKYTTFAEQAFTSYDFHHDPTGARRKHQISLSFNHEKDSNSTIIVYHFVTYDSSE
jgi:hypothetical protein